MKVRKYDKEFKLNAVALVQKGDRTQAAICKELGIPESTMDGWKKAFKEEGDKAFPGSGNIRASNIDLYKLQKELDDVKMERDILKKAVAIFSKPR